VPDTGCTATAVVLVVSDGREVVIGCVRARRPDLALVEGLARLQLSARRCGLEIRVRAPSEEMRGLLELVGLAGDLGVEARREAELGEQVGIEEVVQPRYPLP
jgi:hypothetical protein